MPFDLLQFVADMTPEDHRVLQAKFAERDDTRIAELEADALRFYSADGTYETLDSAEDVKAKRIECAKELVALREQADCYNEIAEAVDKLHDDGRTVLDCVTIAMARPTSDEVCKAVEMMGVEPPSHHDNQYRNDVLDRIRDLFVAKASEGGDGN